MSSASINSCFLLFRTCTMLSPQPRQQGIKFWHRVCTVYSVLRCKSLVEVGAAMHSCAFTVKTLHRCFQDDFNEDKAQACYISLPTALLKSRHYCHHFLFSRFICICFPSIAVLALLGASEPSQDECTGVRLNVHSTAFFAIYNM